MTKPIILNTRPVSLQQSTKESFNKFDFESISLPCIEITTIADSQPVIEQLKSLSTIHSDITNIIIFTSQYAVKYAFSLNPNFSLANSAIVIAVGTKTSHILEQYYSGHIWIPEQQNSEGVIDLLKGLESLDSLKIISAKNGRTLIQNFAEKNHIECEQINVYQRQLPAVDDYKIQQLKQINNLFILATSETTLINLKVLAFDSWDHLLQQTVICASQRIQNKARQLGFINCKNMNTANPYEMAEKLSDSNQNLN
jgi:uroporphyrinogen-III synthase